MHLAVRRVFEALAFAARNLDESVQPLEAV
jgi:hypothetical protein